MTTQQRASVAAGLRAWAAGMNTTAAAVELLLRACGGRFAQPGNAWICYDEQGGRYWLDSAAIEPNIGALSSGERRLLAVVASLADGEQQRGHVTAGVVDLSDVASGLDTPTLGLVLAAIAHAGGKSHLHPWPEPLQVGQS
jgi:hypothetical protein